MSVPTIIPDTFI